MKTGWQWTYWLMGIGLALPAAAADIKEGRWEYTSEMQLGGMNMPQNQAMPKLPEGMKLPPGMKMPQFSAKGMTHTFEQCLTKDQLVPHDKTGPQKCEVTKMDRSGSTVKWAMHCSGPGGDIDGEGSATYNGDSMSSQMAMKGMHDGHPIEMNQKTTGRYLGPCK